MAIICLAQLQLLILMKFTHKGNEFSWNFPFFYFILNRYRGIYLSLVILSRSLSGGYCNFGVFGVYGDPALTDSIDVCLKMALSLPIKDIMVTQKNHHSHFFLKNFLRFIRN